MKLLIGLLCLSAVSLGAPQASHAQTLLTFDDLSPGPSGNSIPIPTSTASDFLAHIQTFPPAISRMMDDETIQKFYPFPAFMDS